MGFRFLRAVLAASLALTATVPRAAAAGVQLTIDQIVARTPVSGTPPSGFTWSPDGSRYVYSVPGATEKAPPVLRVHQMRSGADRVLFAARAQARGSRSRAIGQIVWSPDSTRLAYLNGDALDVARADGRGETALAHGADDPQWSPDGTRIAYVHENDLYVVALANRRVTRLTAGGSATRINGDPDWLYSEEMGVQHAYAWSPAGDAIAFLSFDESAVTDFPIQQFLAAPDNTVEHQRYPLAGEKNPRVALRVVDARGGTARTLYDGGPHDEYLVSFAWTPDGRSVVDEILDRAQRHLRLQAFPRTGGASRILVREADQHFVDVQPAPRFLRDGRSFLWLSTRAGMQALYRVDARTGAARRLSGGAPVADLAQVDERHGVVYVDALAPTRRERALLRVPLDGSRAVVNLTPEPGTHAIVMPDRGDAFIDRFSSLTAPTRIVRRTVHGAAATLFRTPSLARFDLGATKALTIGSQWGPLDATLTTPPGFDAAKTYPAVVEVYGGPLPLADGGEADDRWHSLFDQVLAERGFIVVHVDGPASRNDRTANEYLFSHRMGEIAMQGPLAAAAWLKAQPFVDAARLGLSGWSYGGYLTAYTLTHAPGVFRSGIAGAPPADWRYYDSAYTERYMGMPKKQAVAYERTSVLPAAKNLQSQLLLLQGTSDDNVHLMNTVALLDAFVHAGKQVDYFVFPGARHGPAGIAANRYLEQKMLDWWERTLK